MAGGALRRNRPAPLEGRMKIIFAMVIVALANRVLLVANGAALCILMKREMDLRYEQIDSPRMIRLFFSTAFGRGVPEVLSQAGDTSSYGRWSSIVISFVRAQYGVELVIVVGLILSLLFDLRL